MRPFIRETGIAAPLPLANVDTDQIIPSRFLKGVTRKGLARGLFAGMRYCDDGTEEPTFVLNKPPWRESIFLVAGANFGCGSSREHAPWALSGFGIRAILAPSFGDIFATNCVKNGLLPAELHERDIERLLVLCSNASTANITVDLEAQQVTCTNRDRFAFQVKPADRAKLIEGADEISSSMQHAAVIEAFEKSHLRTVPPIPAYEQWPRE